MFKKRLIAVIIVLCLVFCLPIIPVFAVADTDYNAITVSKVQANTNVAQLQAKGAILMESSSGTIIMEQNSHQKLAIASVTKVMSMLLIMEAIDSGKIKYEDYVPISEHAMKMGGSQLYLDTKESKKYSVKDILKGVAIHSSNDATVAMGEMVAGSESGFVAQMNERAKELGCNDTNFLDCTGLTDDGHYSTAYDLAVMSRELVTKHPKILEFTSIKRDKFGEGVRKPDKVMDLDNTNRLLGRYDGMIGLKTGFTNKAGHNLAAVAKRNNLQLISVVLGEPSSDIRWAETMRLLSYGYANYEATPINKKGECVNNVEVLKGMDEKVNAIFEADVNVLLKKGEKAKLKSQTEWESTIEAPVKAGQKLGVVIFTVDNKQVGIGELVAESDVQKATFLRILGRMAMMWFNIGRI